MQYQNLKGKLNKKKCLLLNSNLCTLNKFFEKLNDQWTVHKETTEPPSATVYMYPKPAKRAHNNDTIYAI